MKCMENGYKQKKNGKIKQKNLEIKLNENKERLELFRDKSKR